MIAILTALLLFQPQDDYVAHFNKALALSVEKKDAEAIAEYQKTLELKPGLYEAQLNLGIVLIRNQRPQEAAVQLEVAAAQKPKEVQPNFNLAVAYLAAAQPAKAEASYKTVLELAPKNANAELGLARSLVAQSLLPEATQHYRKAAELDPKFHDALLELAENYEKAKQPAEAIAIYQQFPGNPAAQKRLNELQLASANTADSIPLLEKAIAASPKDFELRMTLGRTLRDQHQLPRAAQQFFAAAQIQPDSAAAWNELASALIITENYAQGLAALDKVKALGKETPGNMFYRAITLDKLHQKKPAVEAYEQFLAADNGAHPDQEFQARQRARIIKLELSKK
jgi:tetratricopeptide (TPR) repeat protein